MNSITDAYYVFDLVMAQYHLRMHRYARPQHKEIHIQKDHRGIPRLQERGQALTKKYTKANQEFLMVRRLPFAMQKSTLHNSKSYANKATKPIQAPIAKAVAANKSFPAASLLSITEFTTCLYLVLLESTLSIRDSVVACLHCERILAKFCLSARRSFVGTVAARTCCMDPGISFVCQKKHVSLLL